MKMMIILLAMCSSVATFAGDRNSAYQAICKNMTFESERNRCIAEIKPHNYYDDTALMICASFNFDSQKMECLGYIADKYYDAYEVEACRNATFDSQKLACLKNNGTVSQPSPNPNCPTKQEVLNHLYSAQNELRAGNTGTVDKRLTYLIGKFSNPNCQ